MTSVKLPELEKAFVLTCWNDTPLPKATISFYQMICWIMLRLPARLHRLPRIRAARKDFKNGIMQTKNAAINAQRFLFAKSRTAREFDLEPSHLLTLSNLISYLLLPGSPGERHSLLRRCGSSRRCQWWRRRPCHRRTCRCRVLSSLLQ